MPRCEKSRFPAWMFPPLCLHASGRAKFVAPFAWTLERSLLLIRTTAKARRGQQADPKSDAPLVGHLRLAIDHPPLHLDCATHRVAGAHPLHRARTRAQPFAQETEAGSARPTTTQNHRRRSRPADPAVVPTFGG